MSSTKADPTSAGSLSEVIALPSALAAHGCKDVLGIEFDPAAHLLLFEGKLVEAVFDDEQRFLMLNCPPRHGKSMFMQWFAAWYLMMFPTKRVIYVTYGDDLSVLGGKVVRSIVEKFGPRYFDVHLQKNAPAADWALTVSPLSGMLSVGVGSPITGRGGDLIIVDDLIKNAEEAASKAKKSLHVREYDGTIRTRLEPGGTIVVVATRWAEDDLPGTLRERSTKPDYVGDPWEIVELPALAEISEEEIEELYAEYPADMAERLVERWTDELGRSSGDALWPRRYPAKTLRQIQASISELEWAALFQQRPTSKSGGMFPKSAWRYYEADIARDEPEHCVVAGHDLELTNRVWVWDTAFTDDGGDWTCGQLLGLTSNNEIALLEFHRIQGAGAQVEALVKDCAFRVGPSVTILMEQERSGSGKYVIQSFQKLLRGFNLEGRRPEGDKAERATPLSSLVANGGFLLPAGAKFIKAWHNEFRHFPRGRHDDQVDPAVYGYQFLLMRGGTTVWSPVGMTLDAEGQMLGLLQQAGVWSGRHLAALP